MTYTPPQGTLLLDMNFMLQDINAHVSDFRADGKRYGRTGVSLRVGDAMHLPEINVLEEVSAMAESGCLEHKLHILEELCA
jgi:hypothetical protein